MKTKTGGNTGVKFQRKNITLISKRRIRHEKRKAD
jgi:hypothetical protein